MNYEDIKFLPPNKVFSFYREDIKKDSPIEVLVDTHEPDTIFEALKGHGFMPIRKTLDVGDYVFEGGIAFERKSSDFLNFQDVLMKSKELLNTYSHAYLIIEQNIGTLLKLKNTYNRTSTSTNFAQLFGVIGSLSSIGMPPIFAQNQYFLVSIMASIVKKLLDTKDRTIGKIDNIRYATNSDYLKGVYLNLPGVGEKISEALLKKYSTLESLMSAKKEDLMNIENIGQGKAEKIYKFLHQE
jgi:Fanconi anemia group M protein